MSTLPTDPRDGVTSFKDRHGTVRWRYRRKGKTKALPGNPGNPKFEEVLSATIEGRKPRLAELVEHPRSAKPRTMGAAWLAVRNHSIEWQQLSKKTQYDQQKLIEKFLMTRVAPPNKLVWRDVEMTELKRRHIKRIIQDNLDAPQRAKRIVVNIRRLIDYAIDEDWIEIDPTYRLKFNPKSKPWRAWPVDELKLYQDFWPIGTTARTVYAIALWLGDRRSDVVDLRRSDVNWGRKVVSFDQNKTGREMELDLVDELALALFAAPMNGPTFTAKSNGEKRSVKALTGNMANWTEKAGLPTGCTIHGLRKTLGKLAAEGEASTRQLMELLGHSDIAHAELYSRDASRKRLASQAMSKVVVEFKKRVG